MKRIALLLSALFFVIALVACSDGGSAELSGDEEITMENVDEYLPANARFIDLRDFNDMFNTGYVAGFEVVPFFEYLEGRALVRQNGWEFSDADIVDAAILENVFGDKEDVIVLMCGSGTRAGYTKDALESLGYESVINAGGFRDYDGENKVFGDGEYNGTIAITGDVDMSNIDQYLARPNAKYVDLRNVADPYNSGYIHGFEIISFFEYLDQVALDRQNGWEFSEADITEPAVFENIFGDKNREIFLMCGSGTRAGYTKDVLESIGYTTVYNAGGIRDYTGDNRVFGDETFNLVLN